MELVPPAANVELREGRAERLVVLAFPYERSLVDLVRTLPHRRFDWDRREWSAPAEDRAALIVREILSRYPELVASEEVGTWLAGVQQRWIGSVSTRRFDSRGWFVLNTLSGPLPAPLGELAIQHEERSLVPLEPAVAEAIRGQRSAYVDAAAERCLQIVESGAVPAPARLIWARGVEGEQLRLEVLWDQDAGLAFTQLPGAEGTRAVPLDPWLVVELDGFLARYEVEVTGRAREVLEGLLAEHGRAADAVRRSRVTEAAPIDGVRLGGELAPFQWGAVRYALEARRTFLADEQGLGKTVEALACLEADRAFPAVVICPASMKLTWQREAARWLPHRSVTVLSGRGTAAPRADLTILNYEIVAAHRQALAARGPAAIVVDESHYCKNPRARRTQAVRALAAAVPESGLRLALTGTPVLNHAEELIAQLRILDRLHEFGSGHRFAEQFRGGVSEERLHWHLRRRCFVRRRKSEVLPQLPAKRQIVVPVTLANEAEYRLAERDVVAWLRSQPLDLSELDARIAATLRAERLAQLGALQRLAGRGKLAAALAWIEDFLASGEPLVVFARHVEVQRAVLGRFPKALHLLGGDDLTARERTTAAFQRPDGPQLLVAATRVAGQGITLTRASNVAFLELEWTPAMHDQAEDRCHRIGQRDAVSAWYLLAATTIDETMARLIQSKRAHVGAVTDGASAAADGMVAAVVRELREGRPFSHLRAVG
jgi:hypothetical protein